MRAELAFPAALSIRSNNPVLGEALTKMHTAVIDMTIRQLEELKRMKAAGMLIVDRIDRTLKGKLTPAEEAIITRGRRGICKDFGTVARAIRQIIILEQELTGLRPIQRDRDRPIRYEDMPGVSDRAKRAYASGELSDDLVDYYDYRPIGQAIAWVRDTLDVDIPSDDPFPPPPKPEAAKRAPDTGEPEAAATEPETIAETPAPQARRQASHIPAQEIPASDAPSGAPEQAEPQPTPKPGARGPP